MPVPLIRQGRFDLRNLCDLLERTSSHVGSGPAEGLYLRREDGDWLINRTKIVRAEFVQAIGGHWSRRSIEKNRLVVGADIVGRY